MFNGYHEPSPTSYDLELDRGKKNQSASKWTCGNGTNIQSTHLHPQNQQSEIWVSKPSFIELPNTASQKCSCPSCYQIPEGQSYQGELPWHRSWFARTYPVAVNATHDLVKLPTSHQWENAGFGNESYSEPTGGQFMQENGEKSLFYKPYSGLRHEIYQPGVISTVKKGSRKQDLPKHDEVMNIGHHPRYAVSNPSYDSFRTAMDHRLGDERTSYYSQNEKFLNAESCRQQGGPELYGLNANRRTILESFSKAVPLNMNQNRVPSAEHRNTKDNGFHSYTDQNNVEKPAPHSISHGGTEDKHSKTYFQPDVNPGQESLHAGLMNVFSSATVDYHGVNINRDMPDHTGKDFQKFVNGRNPQYFSRTNIPDVTNRNPNSVLNYNINRKGVINVPSGSLRAAETPPKHAEIVSKSPSFGKDGITPEKIISGQKLMMSNNVKIPSDRFHMGNEIPKGENILHGHITRPIMDANASEKIYNCVSTPNALYKGCRIPQEYPYGRRNLQGPNDYPNAMLNLRSDLPVGINIGVPNYPDFRKSLDSYPRVNNAFPYDGSLHQFEKLHYQISGDSKTQNSIFGGPQMPPKLENFKMSEKENPGRISHLEAIPYEDLCKNGTNKISPLRLLRKKKLVHQKKEDVVEVAPTGVVTTAKSASPPLDVRRFWATWAEEEEDNVLQPQMVVLDCHNIDPEQAGLLHLYNQENIRTVNLEDGNIADIKGTQFEKGNDQSSSVNVKTSNLDEKFNIIPENEKPETIIENTVNVRVSKGNVGKTQSITDFPLGVPLIVDPVKEAKSDVETKTKVIVQPNHFRRTAHNQPVLDDIKPFELRTRKDENWNDDHNQKYSNIEKPVLNKPENIPASDSDKKIDRKTENGDSGYVFGKEELIGSDSSDDSQTERLPTLPDLPTSEYRKNKFLDYCDDNFCNGGFLLEGDTSGSSKETAPRKQTDESDSHVEDKLKEFLTSEIGPGNFEIDDILKKLSDINFQGTDIRTESPGFDDSADKHKTDKKILDSKTEKKIKKLSQKSSRTDQVTLQNISLTKPTIKFSIQKSHDLKISFKVLNNKKKQDENEESVTSDRDDQEDRSVNNFEDDEMGDKSKKNKRRLITLKLKGVSDGNAEESLWDEDSARKSKKSLKKKKFRLDRQPSPKAPVLKIKKSRYMLKYGSESEDFHNEANDGNEVKNSAAHGDFQVHETVDSAKIKLTFKRNKNGTNRKEKCSENVDMSNVKSKSSHSENELTSVTGFCVDGIAENSNSAETSNGRETISPSECFKGDNEESNGDTSIYLPDREHEDTNNGSGDESDTTTKTCKPSADLVTVELLCNPDELMIDDFKKEDIAVDPLGIVDAHDDIPLPEDISSLQGDCLVNMSEVEQRETSQKDTEKDLFEPETDSLNLGIHLLPIEVDEVTEKDTGEEQNSGIGDEELGSLSKLDDVTQDIEIEDNKPKEESCHENSLNCAIRQPLINSLEVLLECESDAVKKGKEHEVDEKTAITTPDKEEKKLHAAQENRLDDEKHEYENSSLKIREDNVNNCQEYPVSIHDDNKIEAVDTAEQHEHRYIVRGNNCDCTHGRNDGNKPLIEENWPCDHNLNEEVTFTLPRTESLDETPVASSNSEQPKAQVNPELVRSHFCGEELENTGTTDTVKQWENDTSVLLTDVDKRSNVDDNEVDAEDTDIQVCKIEQNDSETEQSIKEILAKENQTGKEIPKDVVEENSNDNNVKLCRKETVFISRKIQRRCSEEGAYREQGTKAKKVVRSSASLTIELAITDCTKPEIAVLDIAVSDIPLPPGEAPPENCLNLEEYFRSQEKKKKANALDDVKEVTSPRMFMVTESLNLVQDVEPEKTKPCKPVPEDDASCVVDNSFVRVGENYLPCDKAVALEKEGLNDSATAKQQKDFEKSSDAEGTTEIRIEDLEVFETRDTDITLEESSFGADQLYECEGLTFDEPLTITDDMEEEKVSDDDKFRNIMQNCLDNAKKFLCVGNPKLLSSPLDNLVVDNETDAKKLDSHVLKNVEEGNDLKGRHQSEDTFVDFLSSFCPDLGTNPCSEILPVDNWPYLEEEVASSPIRNKMDESDLLCYTDHSSSTENVTLDGKFLLEKNKKNTGLFRAGSERNTRSIAKRRRTIEGVGRWKSFRSTDEELSDVENFILKNDKRLSTRCIRYSKNSGQIYHGKVKKKIKPFSDGEGSRVGQGVTSFKRSAAYYKSSSWQPKVVLFRISTNNMENVSALPNKNGSEMSSVMVSKSTGGNVDQNWDVTHRDKTSRKARECHIERGFENAVNRVNRADGTKRRKSRFRNLHTKKRIVPESSDQTKENVIVRTNGSNLVDSESDSDEASLSRHPPIEIVRSLNKSTKSSSSTVEVLDRKSRVEEEFSRNRKEDSGTERSGEKRKRDIRDSKHESESECKRERSRAERRKPVEDGEKSKLSNVKFRREMEKRCWVCEVCGFSKTSERVSHIQSHPFHCQSCYLAFKTETNFVEHLTRKHKDIRNQHHCLLCELSFDLEKDYYRHLETREHKHLESVEKNTINTLFRLLTGQPCPVLGPVESKPEWLPSQAGTVHFYHQATPLSLALQYLKLHHDKKKISAGMLSSSE